MPDEALRGTAIRHVGLRAIVMAHEVRLTWLQRTVLVAVATYADKKRGRCWPTLTTLAAGTDLTERSVSAAVKQLEKLGVLSVARRGWNRPNLYVIHTAALAALPRVAAASADGDRQSGDAREGRRRTHSRTGSGRQRGWKETTPPGGSGAHPNGTGNGTENGDPPTPRRGARVGTPVSPGEAKEDPAALWLDGFNRATGLGFAPTRENLRAIRERIAEDRYTAADADAVASWAATTWPGTRRGDFIRPSTVFGAKFDGYLQAARNGHARGGFDRRVNAKWDEAEP